MFPQGPMWKWPCADSRIILKAELGLSLASFVCERLFVGGFNPNNRYGFLDVILLLSFSFVCLPKAFLDLRGEGSQPPGSLLRKMSRLRGEAGPSWDSALSESGPAVN